jgi:general secretion pathway protein G
MVKKRLLSSSEIITEAMFERTIQPLESSPTRGAAMVRLLLQAIGVAIILIVVAEFLTPKFSDHPRNANQAAAKQTLSNIQTALTQFKYVNGRVPTTAEGLQALISNPGNLPNWSQTMPKISPDPWGNDYVYRSPGSNGRDYDLLSKGASNQEGNADNIITVY